MPKIDDASTRLEQIIQRTAKVGYVDDAAVRQGIATATSVGFMSESTFETLKGWPTVKDASGKTLRFSSAAAKTLDLVVTAGSAYQPTAIVDLADPKPTRSSTTDSKKLTSKLSKLWA